MIERIFKGVTMSAISYVIWNNKGGVGKSTITFHIASVFAEQHPEKDIVVIDMCPQANSSMMLLGGGKKGEEYLQEMVSDSKPKTIVGFLSQKIQNHDSVDIKDFLVKTSDKNPNLFENLFLLSGDGNLELIAPLLSERAEAKPLSASDNPWVDIHTILRSVTNNNIFPERETVYFIDTNPSFSIYTQIAILGADLLLVPINADDSSIFAITGLFNLIWGTINPHAVYDNYTFSSRVNTYNLERPKISYLLGNRFTQKKGTANAFEALSIEATKKMYDEYKRASDRFQDLDSSVTIESPADFEKHFAIELRDFNSAGVVAANQGLPLSKMDQHSYVVYGKTIQVSKEQRELCKKTVLDLVSNL